MREKDALGRHGEQLATDYLIGRGLTILDRNWRCEAGELDIIARDGAALVIVEVKTRSSARFGSPFEAVSPRKMRRIRELALRWLDEQQFYVPDIRFDVIAIVVPERGSASLEHLQGVS